MKLSVEEKERMLAEAIEALKPDIIKDDEYTIDQLAEMTGRHRNTIMRWMKDGELADKWEHRWCVINEERGSKGWALRLRNGDENE